MYIYINKIYVYASIRGLNSFGGLRLPPRLPHSKTGPVGVEERMREEGGNKVAAAGGWREKEERQVD